MKIITTIAEIRLFIHDAKQREQHIGFVPTMGDLHEGHLALVRASRENSDITVVSIFVNPTQFGPAEDYEKYTRNLDRDSMLCEEEGVDVIFAPAVNEIYPSGHSVVINESFLSRNLCGRSRPGHFSGVLTVVAKLFNIVQPDIAFFGQKDAQQVRLIEQMIKDLNYDIKMVMIPTVRDRDGLALSSRNSYLTPEQRAWVPIIYKSLQKVQELYDKGEKNVVLLRETVESTLIGDGIEVDYIEFVDWNTFKPVEEADSRTLLAVAVKVGNARLIDNVLLT
jgi:pantoate--beta-alanine ligase